MTSRRAPAPILLGAVTIAWDREPRTAPSFVAAVAAVREAFPGAAVELGEDGAVVRWRGRVVARLTRNDP